ncbi:MAG: hypothetical protein ACO3DQ_10905 [Cephaloticoccus sp.]
MSLINNALKKAQRQRAAESAAVTPGGGGAGRRGRDGAPAQLFILLIAGVAVIVVLSVVATVYLLRPAAAPPIAAQTAPAAAAPVAAEPAPAISPAVVNALADERIYAFIDELQVMGVRSSGSDSKVLMRDRVYRVNDIVDRALGLRLIKVTPEALVFEDANGITYTKTF